MLFNSLQFGLFLGVTFAVARALERWQRPRQVWLLLASYAFYAGWNAWYLVLLWATTAVDWGAGRAIGAEQRPARRRAWLALSVGSNLALLGFFKYGNFVAENLEALLTAAGIQVLVPRVPGVLPVGISFYTFQSLSYTVDVYRRTLRPVPRFLDFALFVAFFPQLVAGPILRARDFLPQLDQRPRLDRQAIGEGLAWILMGLVKKMVIADSLAHGVVGPYFAAPERFGAVEGWLALWSSYLGLYCDFSGYSDIAVGAGLLFGFTFPRNFDRPGLSTSPLDHWRRWHVTLQTWLRDYVFVPLGGSRGTPARTALNVVLTFTLGGVWHGAGWNYLWMGVYNGVLAAGWAALWPRADPRPAVRIAMGWVSINLVVLSMAFMRPAPLGQALGALRRVLRWDAPWLGALEPSALGWLAAAAALHVSPRSWKERITRAFAEGPAFAIAATTAAVLGACAAFAEIADPFVYFQF